MKVQSSSNLIHVITSDGKSYTVNPDTCKHKKYTDEFDPVCTECRTYKIKIPPTTGQQKAEKISDHIFKYMQIRIPWEQIWNYSPSGELAHVMWHSRKLTVAEMQKPPLILNPRDMIFDIFSNGLKLAKENVPPELWKIIQDKKKVEE